MLAKIKGIFKAIITKIKIIRIGIGGTIREIATNNGIPNQKMEGFLIIIKLAKTSLILQMLHILTI
jgi:hypothetical protein